MSSNKRKIMAIVNELISNSLNAKASDINVSINLDSNEFKITVKDNGSGMDEKTLARVRKELNQPIKDIYSEYYGELAGNRHTGSGLTIVGYQIDKAQVESSPNGTSISISKKI